MVSALVSEWSSARSSPGSFSFFYLSPLPLNKIFNKIGTVKEKVERAKYSKLIICALIKYIYFRIKSKLERKESWLGSLCCVLGQATLLTQCLSPPKRINGYRRELNAGG